MADVRVTARPPSGAVAPAELLGHNLELTLGAARDLSPDRLDNAKFAGPPNPQTGIARAWHPPAANYAGIHYEMALGEGILGTDAQIMVSTVDRKGKGLLQPALWVRHGESLEVCLWARAIHDPVTLRVGIRPAAIWSGDYDSVPVRVESACWREYRIPLTAPTDDDAAVFFVWIEEPGVVALDQVHLWPRGAGPVRRDVVEAMARFGMPLLRFPGGCITTAYHWKFGTGPAYLRPVHLDPVFKRDMSYEFGTDELLAFCHEFTVTPVVTVNIGTGTPDEAAEWAAYCTEWFRSRRIEAPAMYWQLGNEQYGWWERSHMSGEMYAEVVRELAPGIRRAYPNARIAALGMEHGNRIGTGQRPWRKPLLDAVGELIDVIALQLYAVLPTCADAGEQHLRVLESAEGNARVLKEAAEDCRRRGLRTRVALSEWNLWLHASHFAPQGFVEPMDVQHGIYAATMFHHFARLAPDMEFAAMYQILGCMNTLAVERDRVRGTHMAEVFGMYRPAFPGRIIPLDVATPALKPGISAVDALALESPGGTWVFLVNRSLDRGVDVELLGLPQPGEGRTLHGAGPFDLAARDAPVELSGANVRLPPLSITRLRVGDD